MTEREIGLKVFKSLWNWIRTFNGHSFTLTFDEFLRDISRGNATKLEIYLKNIGSAVKDNDISDSRIESAMRSMALSSNGRVPANPLDVFQFLSNETSQVTWRDTLDVISYVGTESVKDIAGGFEEVGKSIITTGKIINFLLPVIGLIFVYFWVNQKTDGGAKNALDGLWGPAK